MAEVEPPRLFRETAAIDHLRPGFSERPLTDRVKTPVEFLGKNQAEHGVAEEFEALIVGSLRRGFVRD